MMIMMMMMMMMRHATRAVATAKLVPFSPTVPLMVITAPPTYCRQVPVRQINKARVWRFSLPKCLLQQHAGLSPSPRR